MKRTTINKHFVKAMDLTQDALACLEDAILEYDPLTTEEDAQEEIQHAFSQTPIAIKKLTYALNHAVAALTLLQKNHEAKK